MSVFEFCVSSLQEHLVAVDTTATAESALMSPRLHEKRFCV